GDPLDQGDAIRLPVQGQVQSQAAAACEAGYPGADRDGPELPQGIRRGTGEVKLRNFSEILSTPGQSDDVKGLQPWDPNALSLALVRSNGRAGKDGRREVLVTVVRQVAVARLVDCIADDRDLRVRGKPTPEHGPGLV